MSLQPPHPNQELGSRIGLDSSVLASELDVTVKQRLLEVIFGKHDVGDAFRSDFSSFSAYFAYYRRQCIEALAGHVTFPPDRSHHDVIDALALLDGPHSKEGVLENLREGNKQQAKIIHNDVLVRTIELASRIMTMHETSRWDISAQSHPIWVESDPLQECLAKLYSQPRFDERVTFEKNFDIMAVEKLAGFKVIWTDNLAEHLSIHDRGDKQTLRVFHHATYLKAMRSNDDCTLFPNGLLSETLRTLSLLFPHNNSTIRRWFHTKCAEEEYMLDRTVLTCGRITNEQRQIDQFSFWRERLVILKQAFDAAEPTTMSQWWNDRRNRVQWATFWTAALVLLLTVVFGCVQSIEGALQVYKAYHPSRR